MYSSTTIFRMLQGPETMESHVCLLKYKYIYSTQQFGTFTSEYVRPASCLSQDKLKHIISIFKAIAVNIVYVYR